MFSSSIKKTENKKPFTRLLWLLFSERDNLTVFLIYSVMVSLLYLAVPLAAQILINTIAAGILMQPLLMLSVAVLIGLTFLGILRLLQLFITEVIQRKLFAYISLDIAKKIPRMVQKYSGQLYSPELVNRFFDVVTIQKTLNQILLEVPSSFLQILLGVILMGFYSPLLIIFDTVLLFAVAIIIFLGYRGLSTSIEESSAKYKVAHWLEELARCQISFKMNSIPDYLIEETDNRIMNYLSNRKKHFEVIIRQFTASFIIEALASTAILAIGGYLVIEGQLTLGQLVASELIILMILQSTDKIVMKFESWYDLLTSIDKVSTISALELERTGGLDVAKKDNGAEIAINDIVFSYVPERRIFNHLNLKIESGSRTSLVGISGSGKTTLANLIAGLYENYEGSIFFNDNNIRSLDLNKLRDNISFVSEYNEIFVGTVEDNITLGRKNISREDMSRIKDLVELGRDLKQYKDGLKTHLLSEGRNISQGQRHRILMARALITSPQLLILDEAFLGMDEQTKLKIIDKLFAKEQPWTILNISHDSEVVARTDYLYLLDQGKIVEHGDTKELANKDSEFKKLFPELFKLIDGRTK